MDTVISSISANTTEIFEVHPEGVEDYVPQEEAFMLSGDYADLAADLSSLVE